MIFWNNNCFFVCVLLYWREKRVAKTETRGKRSKRFVINTSLFFTTRWTSSSSCKTGLTCLLRVFILVSMFMQCISVFILFLIYIFICMQRRNPFFLQSHICKTLQIFNRQLFWYQTIFNMCIKTRIKIYVQSLQILFIYLLLYHRYFTWEEKEWTRGN